VKRYDDLVAEALLRVPEILPWDLSELLGGAGEPVLLDVREPAEFSVARIAGSINVPRGVLEQSCEWDYDETVPMLAAGRELDIVLVCRSGKRSALAAAVLLDMGFNRVRSLRTGLRGWNDFDRPLVDQLGRPLDGDAVEAMLAPKPRADQLSPRPG
jgi:rhodanese-related sulfurtransferase